MTFQIVLASKHFVYTIYVKIFANLKNLFEKKFEPNFKKNIDRYENPSLLTFKT